MSDLDFDAARDELLTGPDIYSDEWPEPVRHPSDFLLQELSNRHARHIPARLTDVAPGDQPSSGSSGATSTSSTKNKQPGRGHAQAA